MDSKYKKTIRLLYKLTKNIVALPALFSVFLVFFYITGNFQGFQDSTQLMILETLSISSIFFAIVSLFGLLQSIVLFFFPDVVSTKSNIIYLITMVLCLILSASFIAMSLVLGVLTGGI